MAWAAKNSSTQLTNITTEQFFDDLVTLNPREACHVQVDVNFPSTPTDNAIVSVYTTLDDSSENWDDTPIAQFVVDKATDPNAVSFFLVGLYKFRVGVKRSGSTDTITSADMAFKTDGVSL